MASQHAMPRPLALLACAASAFAASSSLADAKVWLDETPKMAMTAGWGAPRNGRSVEGRPLRIASRSFAHGVGTHAESVASFVLDGKAVSFEAFVGVDAEVAGSGDGAKGSVRFSVLVDGKSAFKSPVMSSANEALPVKVSLAGAKTVDLVVEDANDGMDFDHADWADAFFVMKDGAVPSPPPEPEQLGILTPPPPSSPRINGARVLGARPGRPILFRLPVTGDRPMRLSASRLPDGVLFDPATGILSGSVAKAGEYVVGFRAENGMGSAERELKIVVGDKIALTPPMGWNSWNCFAHTVTEKNIRDTAEAFVSSGLADHGWTYVNIDDFWQNSPSRAKKDPTLDGPERNADGSIAVNRRFPDMAALAEYVHSLGLKIGLYSSPGPYTCGGCTGSWGHEWQDAKTYADWGYDYLKYDWCSYTRRMPGGGHAQANAEGHAKHTMPYLLMGEALAAQKRDIVFSLCQYGMDNVSAWGERVGGQCWRTTGDITDTWSSMKSILDRQADLWLYAGPGAWNDPDMLIVGRLGWGSLHPTRLTPNEQYTHISLWAVLCSPLLIGCDMTALDDFTLSLLTNDEVIETNQDELGAQAALVAEGPRAQVWAKPMHDGSLVFALFNTHLAPTAITVDFGSLGIEGRWLVRDLWRQKDLGIYSDHYTAEVPGHATTLVRLFPKDGGRLADGVNDIRMNSVYRRFEPARPVGKPGYRAPKGYPCAECPRGRSL